MSDEYRKMNAAYNKYDTEHANGLLSFLFFWLVGINPILVAFTGFPMISFFSTYLPKIEQNWIQIPQIIAIIFTGMFIVSGFFLGIGIYKLKRTAWNLLKWYFPVVQLFFLAITIPAFFILPLINTVEIFPHPEVAIKNFSVDFRFRLIISFVISFLWFIYCIKSKKAAKQFSGK